MNTTDKENLMISSRNSEDIICSAIHSNDIDLLKNNLQHINLYKKLNDEFYTPLELAVELGHKDIVNLLLQHKLSTGDISSLDGQLLSQPVQNNDIEVVKLLIDAGINVNFMFSNIIHPLIGEISGCALHVASAHGFVEMTQLLLENGADINAHTIPIEHTFYHMLANRTPLEIAIINQHQDVFDLFIANQEKIDLAKVIESTLSVACGRGVEYYALTLINLFESHQFVHSSINATKFILAIVNNDINEAQRLQPLLTVDVNKLHWGKSKMVHLAVKTMNLDMMKALVSWGANIMKKGYTIPRISNLEKSVKLNDIKMVRYLIKEMKTLVFTKEGKAFHHTDYKSTLNNALYCAVLYGHLDIVKELIHTGADVNYTKQEFYNFISILSLSVDQEHHDITRFLLAKGAETHAYCKPDKLSNDKKLFCEITPLHILLDNGNLDLAISFVKKDPMPDILLISITCLEASFADR